MRMFGSDGIIIIFALVGFNHLSFFPDVSSIPCLKECIANLSAGDFFFMCSLILALLGVEEYITMLNKNITSLSSLLKLFISLLFSITH